MATTTPALASNEYKEQIRTIATIPASSVVRREGANAVAYQTIEGSIESTSATHDIAIQAAVDGLTPGRTYQEKVILIGDFALNAGIVLPSYTFIEIQGRLSANGASFSGNGIIAIGGIATRQTDITVTGGTLDGDYANVTAAYHAGIYCEHVNNVLIDKVRSNNNRNHGIDITHTSNFVVQNCEFDNNGDDGITLHNNSYGGTLFNNTISNGRSVTGGSNGIEIEGTAGASCTIVSTGTAATATQVAHWYTTGDRITVSGANEGEYNGSFIITVTDADTFTYTMSGDPVDTATGTIVAGAAPSSVSVTGNICREMPLAGISLISDAADNNISSPSLISICNNTVYSSDSKGINVQGDSGSARCYGITVSGNTIRDCGDAGVTTGAIFVLESDDIVVSNNTLANNDCIGIRVANSGAVTVTDNTINASSLYGMRLISDIDSCIVTGNTFRNGTGFALRIEGTLNGTVSNNLFVDDQSTATQKGIETNNLGQCEIGYNRFVDTLTDGANRTIQMGGTETAGIYIHHNTTNNAVKFLTEASGIITSVTSGASKNWPTALNVDPIDTIMLMPKTAGKGGVVVTAAAYNAFTCTFFNLSAAGNVEAPTGTCDFYYEVKAQHPV